MLSSGSAKRDGCRRTAETSWGELRRESVALAASWKVPGSPSSIARCCAGSSAGGRWTPPSPASSPTCVPGAGGRRALRGARGAGDENVDFRVVVRIADGNSTLTGECSAARRPSDRACTSPFSPSISHAPRSSAALSSPARAPQTPPGVPGGPLRRRRRASVRRRPRRLARAHGRGHARRDRRQPVRRGGPLRRRGYGDRLDPSETRSSPSWCARRGSASCWLRARSSRLRASAGATVVSSSTRATGARERRPSTRWRRGLADHRGHAGARWRVRGGVQGTPRFPPGM